MLTTTLSALGKGTNQGDSISTLEILFLLIKSKPEIEQITIFDYNYLYSANADDTTFVLKNILFLESIWLRLFIFFVLFQTKSKYNKI